MSPSCEDALVAIPPPIVPGARPPIEWSIDAEAEEFVGLVEAGGMPIAVSERGSYEFDGSAWNRIADGVPAHDLSLAGDGALFALRSLSLYRRDDATWSVVRNFGPDFTGDYASVPAVWALSSNQVFVVTHDEYDGGFFYYINNTLHGFDGVSWRALAAIEGGNGVYDMWGTSPSSIYLACSDGLYHFDGNTITKIEAAGTTALRTIGGTSERDIFAIRSDRSILHFDGVAFAVLPAPTTLSLTAARRIGGELFVCGSEGACYRYVGGTWRSVVAGSSDQLTGVWGTSEADIVAVGSGGIVELENGSWRRNRGGAPVALFDIWVAKTGEVFVVGDRGTIEMRDEHGWRPIGSSLYRENLAGISGTSRDDVYAVGASGRILHYDGATWSPMSSNTSAALSAVWVSANTAVAVGGTTILKLDNGVWSPMTGQVPPRFRLLDVWGASNGDLFAVGYFTFEYNGTILRYDGSAWAPVDSEVRPRMFGVWGFAPDDVFAVGGSFPQDGATRYWAAGIYHYDGVSWTRMHVSEDISGVNSLWGLSSDNLVAVGSSGLVLYDGRTWVSESLPGFDGRGLEKVHAADGTDVFGLGLKGVVRFRIPR